MMVEKINKWLDELSMLGMRALFFRVSIFLFSIQVVFGVLYYENHDKFWYVVSFLCLSGLSSLCIVLALVASVLEGDEDG
jgi:hypothetical protein